MSVLAELQTTGHLQQGEQMRRYGKLFQLLSPLLAAALLATHAKHARAQQAYPSPADPPALPYQDPFYSSPSASELSPVAPGTVLRYRDVTPKAYYLFSVKAQAWQVMYRSTDHKDRPIAMVGTVLVPEKAPATGGRKLLSYNIAYDALTLRCAPSYMITKGTSLEQGLIQKALAAGLVVMVSDYEGLDSLWATGKLSGQGVLDGIRAAQSFEPAGLSGAQTPVAVTGYSGGAIAATWANELYKTYSPELNIKAVAAGGVPVDMGNVARKVDGKLFAGVYFGAVAALANAYPEIDVARLSNDRGKRMLERAQDMCLGQFLTGAPDPAVNFAFQKMSNLVTVPELLDEPSVKKVIQENRLGSRVPGAPMYVYQGTLDELMPIADVDRLVQSYCQQGVRVNYVRTFNDHLLLAATGFGKALDYLMLALDGHQPASNCK